MQLDIYIPSLKLAFEYHGEQHYLPVHYYGSASYRAELDQEKRLACYKEGITLIEIPFWWDGQSESLSATVHQVLPSLVDNPTGASPIEMNPESTKEISESAHFRG